MDNIKVIIHWVRHAESCSNLHRGKNHETDDLTRRKGFGLNRNYLVRGLPEVVDIQEEFSESDETTPSQNTRDVSMLSINLLNMASSIPGKIGKFFSTALYEPNLSYRGMQQAILLSKDFVQDNYDAVLCSVMTRTCMTALFSTRMLSNDRIIVTPYISEILPQLGSWNPTDYSNLPNPSELLKKKIALVKDWISYNWIDKYDDIALMSYLLEIYEEEDDVVLRGLMKSLLFNDKLQPTTPRHTKYIFELIKAKYPELASKYPSIIENYDKIMKNLRGLPFDFTLLDLYEMKNSYKEKSKPSHKKFYKEVLPYIIKNVLKCQKKTIKLYIVSHGNFIKDMIKTYHGINLEAVANTQVFEQIIEYKNLNGNELPQFNSMDGMKHIPHYIGKQYENFFDFNDSTCDLEGLKGMINYTLQEIISKKKMGPINHRDEFDFFNKEKYDDLPQIIS